MSTLQTYIKSQRESRPILLMTHVIYGYPTIKDSLEIMETLMREGTDILEVQFPFSDPVADGPTITNACHVALENAPTLRQCLADINALATRYPDSKVVLMSYLNPMLQFGFKALAGAAAPAISGLIIPDLPIEQASFAEPLKAADIAPIWLTIPQMDSARLAQTLSAASGMLYCVSRSGVTGGATAFDAVTDNLDTLKQQTSVPLGVGFGISKPEHITALIGHADIAIVGSALLNAYNEAGLTQLVTRFKSLQTATR